MGAQDVDLMERFRMLHGAGCRRVRGVACGAAIPNSKLQAISCCDPALAAGSLRFLRFNRAIVNPRFKCSAQYQIPLFEDLRFVARFNWLRFVAPILGC